MLGFLVSMPAFIESGIFVTSPSIARTPDQAAATATPPTDDIKVNIFLADNGDVYLNEEVVTNDQLQKLLPDLLARSSDRKVIVGTDFHVIYDRVIHVLDIAKQAGAGQLCLLRRARA